MAERYQRSTPYRAPGADFGEAQFRGQLASVLSEFAQRTGQAFLERRAAEGERAGSQVTGTPKLKSRFTAFGQAYNNAAIRNYSIEQFTEIEKQLGRLENESTADPEKFQALADGVRRGMLKNALPEARPQIAQMFNRRLAEGVVRLDSQRIEEQKKFNRGMLEQGLETLSDTIARKAASGDPSLLAEIEEDELQYELMIEGGLNDGTLSKTEAAVLKQEGKRRITTQVITGLFEREAQSGNPVAFLEKLMDGNPDLSEDEKYQLVGDLFTRLNRRNALIDAAAQQETDLLKQRYAQGEKHATEKLLAGQLTTGEILKLVEDDWLEPGTARTLQNELESGGAKFDDDRERFHVETNLLEISEEEIATNPRLSWETRRILIQKRRDLEAGWRGTQQAREGAERIDRALGLLPGVPVQMLDPETQKRRERALTEWYDAVDALPPEERQAKAIELSETIIDRILKRDTATKLERTETRLRNLRSKDVSKMRGNELNTHNDTIQRLEREIADLRSKIQ